MEVFFYSQHPCFWCRFLKHPKVSHVTCDMADRSNAGDFAVFGEDRERQGTRKERIMLHVPETRHSE